MIVDLCLEVVCAVADAIGMSTRRNPSKMHVDWVVFDIEKALFCDKVSVGDLGFVESC